MGVELAVRSVRVRVRVCEHRGRRAEMWLGQAGRLL